MSEEQRRCNVVASRRSGVRSNVEQLATTREDSLSVDAVDHLSRRLRGLQQALFAGEVDVASRVNTVKVADWIPGVVATGGIFSAEINGAALGVREAARHV